MREGTRLNEGKTNPNRSRPAIVRGWLLVSEWFVSEARPT
jgi:hypothetical protein